MIEDTRNHSTDAEMTAALENYNRNYDNGAFLALADLVIHTYGPADVAHYFRGARAEAPTTMVEFMNTVLDGACDLSGMREYDGAVIAALVDAVEYGDEVFDATESFLARFLN